MHIYCNQDEVVIEGSTFELRNISRIIRKSKIGTKRYLKSSLNATAEPYDALCEELILDCNGVKIKGSVENRKLRLEFSEETKDIISSFFEFEDDALNGKHFHLDKYGNEDYFADDSIDMIAQVRND